MLIDSKIENAGIDKDDFEHMMLGEEVILTDLDIIEASTKIMKNYGDNIDHMEYFQGLIDSMFTQIKNIYETKLWFYVFTFLLPYLAALFKINGCVTN